MNETMQAERGITIVESTQTVTLKQRNGDILHQQHDGADSWYVKLDFSDVPDGTEIVVLRGGMKRLDEGLARVSLGSGLYAVWATVGGHWLPREARYDETALEARFVCWHALTGDSVFVGHFKAVANE